MHHSSPSTITYPSSPSSPQPHCSTTSTCPTPHLTALRPVPALLHPALLPIPALPPALRPTSLPYDLHLPYSTQPYYPPHCPTTCTRPPPPCSTTHLTAPPPAHDLLHHALLPTSLPHHLHQPYYSAIYPRSAYPTYVHTAPISTTALSPATHTILHTAHTCHTPHRPAHLPHRCTIPPPYPIGSTTQP